VPDTQPTATVAGQSIALHVTGYPDLPNRWGSGHIRPIGIRLDYGNSRTPDGRHALVTGFWVREDGQATDDPVDRLYDAHNGDMSDWPGWLAELVKAHDPAAVPVASPSPDQTALRARIAEVLVTTSRAEWPHKPGMEKWDHHKHGDRPGHTYSISCALCTGDVDRLAEVLTAEVGQLRADLEHETERRQQWQRKYNAEHARHVEVVRAFVTDRAAVLRQEAALIRAHCPDHLDSQSAEGSWITCHCDVADDMERRASEAPQQAPWATDSARIGRVLIWSHADIGSGDFGRGYRAAQEEARAILTRPLRGAEAQQPDTETPCGPAPDACDAEAGEPCANHEREQAHTEGEHCFCGPECPNTGQESGRV